VLLARGVKVVALLQPEREEPGVAGLDVEKVAADLSDAAAVADAAEGCRAVFHVAALYRFWSKDPDSFYRVNVGGTRNVMEAARRSGCERVVYTSTVGTIGLAGGSSADETSYAQVGHLFGLYKQSKYVAEHEVLRAAAEGLPVVLVQPTFPVGPRDHAPTPSGKLVLDYMNGKMPGFVDTALNVVDVEDVAAGHLLAAECGRTGRSYILGGENLSLARILAMLAEITGLPPVSRRVPRRLALVAAHASDLVQGRLLRREPSVPLEGTRMASTQMLFDDSRARAELGYVSRPAAEALTRSARWYAENGYVTAARLARCSW
jgi:dihydroflavonol-4-reductase